MYELREKLMGFDSGPLQSALCAWWYDGYVVRNWIAALIQNERSNENGQLFIKVCHEKVKEAI